MRKTIRGLRQPCLGDALSENNMPISNTLTYNDTYANGLSWYMLTTILVGHRSWCQIWILQMASNTTLRVLYNYRI